jgi:hypothetical protein
MANLRAQLEQAVDVEDYAMASDIKKELEDLYRKDPEEMAKQFREKLDAAVAAEHYVEAALRRDELDVIKQHLPQYQLAGYWKGSYPSGEVMVRIHYEGDMLIATKQSDSPYVPVGEVTFRADVSKPSMPNSRDQGLAIEVVSVNKENQKQMPVGLFGGEGRISRQSNEEAHWTEGALCLTGLDDMSFGFLWVPVGLFVVFRRPDAEGDTDEHVHVEIQA